MANVQASHADSDRHALVLGASGIIGWACVNALVSGYPSEDAFREVTALTNRPLDLDTNLWPTSSKLQLTSGIDLLEGDQQQLEKTLQERANIASVTHVYFCAYIQDSDAARETQINGDLLQRSIIAIEKLAPNLEFVLLPIGTKVILISIYIFK